MIGTHFIKIIITSKVIGLYTNLLQIKELLTFKLAIQIKNTLNNVESPYMNIV